MWFAAIGGVTGQLLEQNAQALHQISANFAAFKVTETVFFFLWIQLTINLIIFNSFWLRGWESCELYLQEIYIYVNLFFVNIINVLYIEGYLNVSTCLESFIYAHVFS